MAANLASNADLVYKKYKLLSVARIIRKQEAARSSLTIHARVLIFL